MCWYVYNSGSYHYILNCQKYFACKLPRHNKLQDKRAWTKMWKMFTRNFFFKVVSSVWIKIKKNPCRRSFYWSSVWQPHKISWILVFRRWIRRVMEKYIIFKFDIGKYYILTYVGLDMHVRSNRNSINVQGVCFEWLRDKLSTMMWTWALLIKCENKTNDFWQSEMWKNINQSIMFRYRLCNV